MEEAVGILEVYGLVCAFMAADAGCKAGNVRLEPFDKNKPANADSLPVPLLVTIKFRGSVSDVEAAMEAGERMAKSLTGVVQKHVIPRPTADTEKMLKLCAFDKSYREALLEILLEAGTNQSSCQRMADAILSRLKRRLRRQKEVGTN